MILFGFIHSVIIGGADILAFYGLTGLIIGWVLFKPPHIQRKVMIITGCLTFISILVLWLSIGQFWVMDEFYNLESYIESLVMNTSVFPFLVLVQLFMYPFLFVILIGICSAKKRMDYTAGKASAFFKESCNYRY